jgi:hypothetical protein
MMLRAMAGVAESGPLPPRENGMTVRIRAGEMAYPHPPTGHP